ncbi:MAG: hypothetical protein KJS77_10120 [Planctomycetes bacterium]|nr:hypothetical protein [Planctomycetota bacterium]
MTLVVGTDEAGYGPNLGPLVIAATAWEAATDADGVEGAFARAADGIDGLWGDSKRIFRGGAGFAALERGAVAGVAACGGGVPDRWSGLLAAVAACDGEPAEWAESAERLRLPREISHDDAAAAAEKANGTLVASGLRLVAVRCRLVQPREFNALLDTGLNKSDILSRATLDLAAPFVNAAAGESVVWCDRHGGRRRYAPLVSRAFASPLVQVISETPDWSAYRLPSACCRIEFSVRGESRLPVAMASMTAKYVRELAMAAFNAWWGGRCAGLEPTAGYPVDAVRWRRDAEASVQAAGLGWDDLWRKA